jgi:hypothetical protein
MLTDAELQYFYFGFYKALKRYRLTSIAGWSVVLLGCLSVPFGWNLGRATGVTEVFLTLLTVFAGLTVVWQNIAALEQYVRIPFPDSSETQALSVVQDIRDLMKEVDEGGWQDAYDAIGKLKEMQAKHNLPPLDSH